jgi:hypothetical protein
MHQVFDEGGKGEGLSVEQGETEEKDLFAGEILSKMADKEARPHECRFRRQEHREGALKNTFSGNGLP